MPYEAGYLGLEVMPYEIVRSKRKTMAIHVYRNGRVLIRAPLRSREKDIDRFFSSHSVWISKKLEESDKYPGLEDSRYIDEGTLWLLGTELTISVVERAPQRVIQIDKKIVVEQNNMSDVHKTGRLLTKWKRNFATNYLQQRLAFWSEQFPFPLKSYQFRIRKMKRQWGNCNHKGVITINSQLIRYPQVCIDYVIIHELTHLKHLNHSRSFYGLLEKVMPDWEKHKRLLSQFSGNTETDA